MSAESIYSVKNYLAALLLFFGLSSCGTSPEFDQVYTDQQGLLVWGYPPELDGTGMTFRLDADSLVYGLEGDLKDFQDIFEEGENTQRIEADFVLTGKETVRGWGITFKEIKMIRISKL